MWLLRPAHKHIGQGTLSEHLDGRLRGRPLERVERQLGECDACRHNLAELQATVAVMRQMPMEAPRRSFVMSAPPPEPVRVRPALALRAPNWVYAGAASVAALALAITVSVDVTGGLSSEPLRRDFQTTAVAPTAASVQVTGVSGPESGPGPAGVPAMESAARSEDAADSSEDETAPPSLAAAAPATALGAAQPPLATPAPDVAQPDTVAQDSALALTESSSVEPGLTVVVPQDSQVAGPRSAPGAGDTSAVEDQAAKSTAIEAPAPIPEPAEPELFDAGADGKISIWWRVLEAGAGALALVFLAGLILRWRAGRRYL